MIKVYAVKFDGEMLSREFCNFKSADRFIYRIMCNRTMFRYKKISIVDDNGNEILVYEGIPKSEAKAFFDACAEIWGSGGAVSTGLIAETLNIIPSTIDRMLTACVVWDLPISKASGMWVF